MVPEALGRNTQDQEVVEILGSQMKPHVSFSVSFQIVRHEWDVR
jgi:hypothetical protein